MSDALTHPNPRTDADYEAMVQRLFAEMNLIEEQMDRNRSESDRLKSETQAIKARAEVRLADLENQISGLCRAS